MPGPGVDGRPGIQQAKVVRYIQRGCTVRRPRGVAGVEKGVIGCGPFLAFRHAHHRVVRGTALVQPDLGLCFCRGVHLGELLQQSLHAVIGHLDIGHAVLLGVIDRIQRRYGIAQRLGLPVRRRLGPGSVGLCRLSILEIALQQALRLLKLLRHGRPGDGGVYFLRQAVRSLDGLIEPGGIDSVNGDQVGDYGL